MLRYMYFTYCTMARYTTIIALFLCLKETNAQIKSFMNNANLRQDGIQDGTFGNLGGSSTAETIHSNTNFLSNSFPQRMSNFSPIPTQPTTDHFSSNFPHQLPQPQSYNIPQSQNFPATPTQRSYQSSNSAVPSPFLKSFNFQETPNTPNIFNAQEPKQISNLQTAPLNVDYFTPISIPDDTPSFFGEQVIQPDVNTNLNPVVTLTQSIPSPVMLNMAETSPYSIPTVVQLGSILPTHAQSINVLRSNIEPLNPNQGYIISSNLPVSTYFEKPKPSIWKELLPLIINMIKEERSRGCCGCKCCCKNKRNNKLEVCGGYSNQRKFGHSSEATNELDDENLSVEQNTQTSEENDKQRLEVDIPEDSEDSEET